MTNSYRAKQKKLMSELTKPDIATRQDVELLVDSFYKKVVKDETIGFFFSEVVKLDWEKHIPVMYDFWESILFQKSVYKGNPMTAHFNLNAKHPIDKKHFDRWLKLFTETITELFEGNTAELAKIRALSIATVIQIKISAN